MKSGEKRQDVISGLVWSGVVTLILVSALARQMTYCLNMPCISTSGLSSCYAFAWNALRHLPAPLKLISNIPAVLQIRTTLLFFVLLLHLASLILCYKWLLTYLSFLPAYKLFASREM